jgi:hypothetical protein
MDRREFLTGLSVAAVSTALPAHAAIAKPTYSALYDRWLFTPGEGLKWTLRHLATGMEFGCRGVKDNHFYDVVTTQTGWANPKHHHRIYWDAYGCGLAAKHIHKFQNHEGPIYYQLQPDDGETLTLEVVNLLARPH